MPLDIPNMENKDGDLRRIGLELEFAGLDLEEAARIIRSVYGGEVEEENRYHYIIRGTELGTFEVELDARILKKMAGGNFLNDLGMEIDEQKIRNSISDVLDRLAKTVVPLEIVMPPVPIDRIDRLEPLRKELQEQKAEGTDSSLIHAFGLHINVEVPEMDAGVVLDYLRAFFVLYPWLLDRLNIDFSRRLSPFIDHFPAKYVRMVLDPAYRPGMEQLMEDYLAHNPTRNRPLDLMPIWAMVDEKRTSEVLKGEKNRPRPTFHYRLPNSSVDDPEWTFRSEWERWLAVERLAADDEMLAKLCRLYLLREEETYVSFFKEWAGTVEILLEPDAQQ